jgi:signal peptidase I
MEEEGTQRDDAPLERPARARHAKAPTRSRRWFIETITVVVVAVVVAVLLRSFVVATYSIPSGSMEPTLNIGDRILVNKLSYKLHGIGRGNIIVFATPSDEHCAGPPVPDLVKRVVALGGETISLTGGQVYINGKLLPQPWLPSVTQHQTEPGPGAQPYALVQPYKVPKSDVFVMGDNRTQSCDSRYWGPIPTSSIVGQVDVRIWPVARFHLF